MQASDKKTLDQIYELNFKVLARESALRHIQRILHVVKYVAMAKYEEEGKHWNYMKIKGPLFLIEDKYKHLKLVILNQCSTENFILAITTETKFECLKLQKESGYMLNYYKDDSIMGRSIVGLWTVDDTINQIYKDIVAAVKNSQNQNIQKI